MPNNPSISPMLRIITAIEVWVLIITGFGLFFFAAQLNSLWPWSLSPFNAGFLGSIYLSSLTAASLLVWNGRWIPARIITAMILAFTSIVFFVSMAYLSRFDQTRTPSVWSWFILYAILPINAAYHLWLYRNSPKPDLLPIPVWLKTILLLQSIIFGSYGIALLFFPTQATGFWPWAIDDFHGRMYSVASITPAVGAFMLYRNPNMLEMKSLSLIQIVGGVFPILSLVLVDSSVHRINWLAFGTWLWIGLGIWLLLVGILMIWEARQ
jgi:hypothetical protein